jgi:hypothetical protein
MTLGSRSVRCFTSAFQENRKNFPREGMYVNCTLVVLLGSPARDFRGQTVYIVFKSRTQVQH